MKSLGLLNFLIALNLVNLTNNIQSLDAQIFTDVSALGSDRRGFAETTLGRTSVCSAGGGSAWGCKYKATEFGASVSTGVDRASSVAGKNLESDTTIIDFGSNVAAGSASAWSPDRSTNASPTGALVTATGAVRGLGTAIADLMRYRVDGDIDFDHKPVPVMADTCVSGLGEARVTRSGLVRPGAARRTRPEVDGVSRVLAPVPLTRLKTISEFSPEVVSPADAGLPESVRAARVRSRSNSSPSVPPDPVSSALLLIAGAVKQSSGHLAAQAEAAAIANQLLEQKLAAQERELLEHKRVQAVVAAERAAELAEKTAYARRPWYKRAEARAEFWNCTAVLCSAAASATAITALYYQNNPQ